MRKQNFSTVGLMHWKIMTRLSLFDYSTIKLIAQKEKASLHFTISYLLPTQIKMSNASYLVLLSPCSSSPIMVSCHPLLYLFNCDKNKRFLVINFFSFGIIPRMRPQFEAGFTGNRLSFPFQRVKMK